MDVADGGLHDALLQSTVEAKSLIDEEWIHQKRLGELLMTNGLNMLPVARNGDCIFESTAQMVCAANPVLNAANLRSVVCSHMLEYRSEYAGYVCDDIDFEAGVKQLESLGCWNKGVGNIVPYVLAILFQCQITIYSSHPSMQIINILLFIFIIK